MPARATRGISTSISTWTIDAIQIAIFDEMLFLQDWEAAPELAMWAKRMRIARAQGTISEERLQVMAQASLVYISCINNSQWSPTCHVYCVLMCYYMHTP